MYVLDVDWEYPGGNGQDYKQNPNSGKVDEITNYALFLQDIKSAIGSKELSIAVPGLERDMIAFTDQQVPLISAAVDYVNVSRYDRHTRWLLTQGFSGNDLRSHEQVNLSVQGIVHKLTIREKARQCYQTPHFIRGLAQYRRHIYLTWNGTKQDDSWFCVLC